ncbi:hypothetical protein ElyMa_006833900 [Elysia marginata]|uniref:Uncharacterized protein n=1 Tax=Elysia marginata TaxID=1093978 RepID=A0AAV4J8T6_9GAST|nr:hypothetical protein ElyMa_006833900 [Elysia marginata]
MTFTTQKDLDLIRDIAENRDEWRTFIAEMQKEEQPKLCGQAILQANGYRSRVRPRPGPPTIKARCLEVSGQTQSWTSIRFYWIMRLSFWAPGREYKGEIGYHRRLPGQGKCTPGTGELTGYRASQGDPILGKTLQPYYA